MSIFDADSARELLTTANLFFGFDPDDPDDDKRWSQTLNLSDAFYWGCADCEYVQDDDLPRLAELFWLYGQAGMFYWVLAEKRGGDVPEFLDVRRQIEFVANEEAIRKEEPSSDRRAYLKRQYTIGEGDT